MKKYHYLRPRIEAILWPVGLIYTGIVVIRFLSSLPIITISFWYWLLFGPIVLLSYLGIWIELGANTLVYRVFFIRKLTIPIQNITRLVKGPSYGLAHTDCMYCYYQNNDGVEKYIITILFNHSPKEVVKFITDITNLNSNIVVDAELKKLLTKKLHLSEGGSQH